MAYDGYQTLEFDVDRGVLFVTIDSPPINLMTLDMVDDLRRFVAQLTARSDPTLQIRSVEVAEEFHATVPGVVLNRALRSFHSTTKSDGEV